MPWMNLSQVLLYLNRKRIDPVLFSVYLTRDDLNAPWLKPTDLETSDVPFSEDEIDEETTEEE